MSPDTELNGNIPRYIVFGKTTNHKTMYIMIPATLFKEGTEHLDTYVTRWKELVRLQKLITVNSYSGKGLGGNGDRNFLILC